ncbi:MAG: DNA polymerase I [Candidatus Riflebacteria bacterium]|nr:DNA polymerase I [Candidatus Riflebacteria bacterium]
MKRIFLFDAHSLLYRAHFAFLSTPLITSKGLHTSAVFGFVNMLFSVLEREKPDYVAIAFDKSRQTFRTKLYPEYKANRAETPPELKAQFPYARDVVRALNVPVVESDDFEADDLLGAMARRFSSPEVQAVIVTGDRDALQLVGPRVSVMMTKKGTQETILYDPARVQADFGVRPDQIVDVKALQGDPSDNIPGVPGVGPKTATKLISEHGTLDGVYARLATVKGKLHENLEQHKDLAYLSRELARIRVDLDPGISLEDCAPRPPDRDGLRRLFAELEMRKLASLIETGPQEVSAVDAQYRAVLTPDDFEQLLRELAGAQVISLDTETTSLQPMEASLVGLSLAVSEGQARYIPLAHSYLGVPPQLDRNLVLRALEPILADSSRRLVGQNLKFDFIVLERHGLALPPPHFDTMVASYVLDPSRMQHGLDALALEYLNIRPLAYGDVVPRGQTFESVNVDTATRYSGEDADLALRMYHLLRNRLETTGLLDLFHQVEMPLLPVLARMEMNGIAIDPAYLEALGKELATEIRTLEQRIHELAGEPFNVNSQPQLAHILFEKLGLPVIRKTKTGLSTDAAVLEELEKAHGSELAAHINRYRHLVKLKGTYVDTLPQLVNPETARIHTSFNQVAAATGRLSSSDPNLQNIPVRTELGNRIRKAFCPDPPGWLFVGADYSQIELRIMAHVTGSAVLQEAFRTNEDIHAQTASLIFGVPRSQVDSGMRNRAKTINFGILYGMGPFGLASRLELSQTEAKAFIDGYFQRLPEVKRYIDSTVESARKDGHVTTLLGRRRFLPEFQASSAAQRAFAERTAVNTPIQGTAADLIKLAMIRLQRELDQRKMRSRLLLQIHDELVLECPPEEAQAAGTLMKHVMETALELSVPLVANVRSGTDWSQLK